MIWRIIIYLNIAYYNVIYRVFHFCMNTLQRKLHVINTIQLIRGLYQIRLHEQTKQKITSPWSDKDWEDSDTKLRERGPI